MITIIKTTEYSENVEGARYSDIEEMCIDMMEFMPNSPFWIKEFYFSTGHVNYKKVTVYENGTYNFSDVQSINPFGINKSTIYLYLYNLERSVKSDKWGKSWLKTQSLFSALRRALSNDNWRLYNELKKSTDRRWISRFNTIARLYAIRNCQSIDFYTI